MNRLIQTISLCVLTLLLLINQSDATNVFGPQSGTWTLTNNPYNVIGDIRIPSNQSLTIEPGVQVIFQGWYKFIINGQLQAVGTETDSISFTAANPNTGWNGLRFYNLYSQPDSSRLIYCKFTEGKSLSSLSAGDLKNGGAIFCSHASNLRIEHCLFFDNQTGDAYGTQGSTGGGAGGSAVSGDGGAIYLMDSDIIIQESVFSSNRTGNATGGTGGYGGGGSIGGPGGSGGSATSGGGGAIFFQNSVPWIVDNQFVQNNTGNASGGHGGEGGWGFAYWPGPATGGRGGDGGGAMAGAGGAFCINFSFPLGQAVNNLFIDNLSGSGIGGSGGNGGSAETEPPSSHTTPGDGGNGGNGSGGNGGIAYLGASLSLKNLTASDNQVGGATAGPGGAAGGGWWPADPGLPGTAVPGIAVIYSNDTNNSQMTNTIFWGNTGQLFFGNVQVSYSCLQQPYPGIGNIIADPLFTRAPEGSCFLSQLAAGQQVQSPCIDAGDPISNMIPGTTRIDGIQDSGIIDMGYHYPCFLIQQILQVSVDTLIFFAAPGGSNPVNQSFQISNGHNGFFNYEISDDSDWLTIEPASGGPVPPTASVIVSVDITGLGAGTYFSSAIVNAPAAQGSPDTVIVVLNLIEPNLWLTADSLTFTGGYQGSNPPAQSFIINNSTYGTFNYLIEENTPWLTVNPMSGGPVPPVGIEIVMVNTTGLLPGNYEGDIVVTAPGSTGSPQTVHVNLVVTAPVLLLTEDTLSFGSAPGFSNPPSQQFLIYNSSTLPSLMSFAISDNTPWLSVQPMSGGPVPPAAIINVSVTTDTLGAGTYYGAIIVTAPYALNSPDTVRVVFTLIEPTLNLSAHTLIFNANYLGANPPSQNIIVQNATFGNFNYSIDEDIPWLNVSPMMGGPVPPTDTLVFSVNAQGYALGSYEGDIQVTAPGALGSPQTVHCILNVQPHLSGPLYGILPTGAYEIVGNITINSGYSLFIQPGTTLIFTNATQLEINGYIAANGTEENPIYLLHDPPNNWQGVRFNDSAIDSSILTYCEISSCYRSAVSCIKSSPTFKQCTIKNNIATVTNYGAGVYLDSSNAVFENCNIFDNYFTNSTIRKGGGIYCTSAAPRFTGCMIYSNSVSGSIGYGGGVYCEQSSAIFDHCAIFFNNSYATDTKGIGVYALGGNPQFINCTVVGNDASNLGQPQGGGAYLQCEAQLQNCLFAENYPENIFFGNSYSWAIYYSDFYNQIGANFTGTVPINLGMLIQTNANGDSCDNHYNIPTDPLLTGITYLSNNSPCIDAGNPSSPLDPDGSIADMGAFYSGLTPTTPVGINLTPIDPPLTIPAGGGSFQYNLNVYNGDTLAVNMDIWTMMKKLPGGLWSDPMFNANRTLGAGASPIRQRNQGIAGSLPAGIYLYRGYTGDYPGVIWDVDTFFFTKLTVSDGSRVDGFANNGEDFDDLNAINVLEIPDTYSLTQNYPNPFNPLTTISFGLPETAQVKLTIFDVMGREVATLVNGMRDAGIHNVTFDATGLASGIYLYRIEAGSFTAIHKMVLMK